MQTLNTIYPRQWATATANQDTEDRIQIDEEYNYYAIFCIATSFEEALKIIGDYEYIFFFGKNELATEIQSGIFSVLLNRDRS